MINDPQKAINSLFHPFFMTFQHLSYFLSLSTLSSLHMNDLEEGCAHLPEILNGMKLK